MLRVRAAGVPQVPSSAVRKVRARCAQKAAIALVAKPIFATCVQLGNSACAEQWLAALARKERGAGSGVVLAKFARLDIGTTNQSYHARFAPLGLAAMLA